MRTLGGQARVCSTARTSTHSTLAATAAVIGEGRSDGPHLGGLPEDGAGVVEVAVLLVEVRERAPQRVRLADRLGCVNRLDRLGVRLDLLVRVLVKQSHALVPLLHAATPFTVPEPA